MNSQAPLILPKGPNAFLRVEEVAVRQEEVVVEGVVGDAE